MAGHGGVRSHAGAQSRQGDVLHDRRAGDHPLRGDASARAARRRRARRPQLHSSRPGRERQRPRAARRHARRHPRADGLHAVRVSPALRGLRFLGGEYRALTRPRDGAVGRRSNRLGSAGHERDRAARARTGASRRDHPLPRRRRSPLPDTGGLPRDHRRVARAPLPDRDDPRTARLPPPLRALHSPLPRNRGADERAAAGRDRRTGEMLAAPLVRGARPRPSGSAGVPGKRRLTETRARASRASRPEARR